MIEEKYFIVATNDLFVYGDCDSTKEEAEALLVGVDVSYKDLVVIKGHIVSVTRNAIDD